MNNRRLKSLFLDDIRHPKDAYSYSNQEVYLNDQWIVVRTYEAFCDWITQNGLPDFISFDHDLADENYQHGTTETEKTGYDCAVWLVDYCLDHQLICPPFYCHSMNPVGKAKIEGLLRQFSESAP
ncbi:MAG: cyclic-phosphate processing receiver domain-containing protein [Bacteroidales bacterium]